jgi:hypothetical protein
MFWRDDMLAKVTQNVGKAVHSSTDRFWRTQRAVIQKTKTS